MTTAKGRAEHLRTVAARERVSSNPWIAESMEAGADALDVLAMAEGAEAFDYTFAGEKESVSFHADDDGYTVAAVYFGTTREDLIRRAAARLIATARALLEEK